jgi:type I restriction enzyme S subunit
MIFKPYALMVFMSPQFRAFVKTLNTGSLIQHMFTKDINCFYFPIPSLPEQQRIAQEFERRFSVLDQVEATINASLRRCGQLRQAVLERAFGG